MDINYQPSWTANLWWIGKIKVKGIKIRRPKLIWKLKSEESNWLKRLKGLEESTYYIGCFNRPKENEVLLDWSNPIGKCLENFLTSLNNHVWVTTKPAQLACRTKRQERIMLAQNFLENVETNLVWIRKRQQNIDWHLAILNHLLWCLILTPWHLFRCVVKHHQKLVHQSAPIQTEHWKNMKLRRLCR